MRIMRVVTMDSADKFAAFAKEMSEFLQTSEITRDPEHSCGLSSKATLVKPGRATILYTIPTPLDSPIGGQPVVRNAASLSQRPVPAADRRVSDDSALALPRADSQRFDASNNSRGEVASRRRRRRP